VLGNVYVTLPAVAAAWNVIVPELDPFNVNADLLNTVEVPTLYTLPAARFKSLLTVVVPVPAPIARAVALPAKFTVVAVVFNKSKLVLGVVRLVDHLLVHQLFSCLYYILYH
jgi:hypothetical protein